MDYYLPQRDLEGLFRAVWREELQRVKAVGQVGAVDRAARCGYRAVSGHRTGIHVHQHIVQAPGRGGGKPRRLKVVAIADRRYRYHARRDGDGVVGAAGEVDHCLIRQARAAIVRRRHADGACAIRIRARPGASGGHVRAVRAYRPFRPRNTSVAARGDDA